LTKTKLSNYIENVLKPKLFVLVPNTNDTSYTRWLQIAKQ